MAQAYKAVSPALDDGRKVNKLNVISLVTELTGLGVVTAAMPRSKVEKVALLESLLSKKRARSGILGQLENGVDISSMSEDDLQFQISKRGGDPNYNGDKQLELRRIVRLTTGRLSPAPALPVNNVVMPNAADSLDAASPAALVPAAAVLAELHPPALPAPAAAVPPILDAVQPPP